MTKDIDYSWREFLIARLAENRFPPQVMEMARKVFRRHDPARPGHEYDTGTCDVCIAGGWNPESVLAPCEEILILLTLWKDHPEYDHRKWRLEDDTPLQITVI